MFCRCCEQVEPEALSALQLSPAVLTPSRANGFMNMLEAMRKRARALSGAFLPAFPSLRVTANDVTPQGAFAIAQAQFLEPEPAQVDALVKVCILWASWLFPAVIWASVRSCGGPLWSRCGNFVWSCRGCFCSTTCYVLISDVLCSDMLCDILNILSEQYFLHVQCMYKEVMTWLEHVRKSRISRKVNARATC